ncbi:YetF domain-containing protein [Saccharomonospora sp. NB11]|uniref:DUF421 domain-containing protein n=1 Tax=Saccharomonospora sp. NB11 TaxID=1642298 RepID=UPI0027DE77F1|nr:YetF domain-containing protein [Saccharomonospora sp. NB11]
MSGDYSAEDAEWARTGEPIAERRLATTSSMYNALYARALVAHASYGVVEDMADWTGMFTLDTPALELVLRGVFVYLLLLVLLRVAGQREAGGLGLTDVLIVVLIAQSVGGGLAGDSESLADAAVLATTILSCSVAVDAATYRFPRLASLLKARPRLLIENGRLNRRVLRREFMTADEVRSQLRLHGIEDIAGVRVAYLEPNGMISVLTDDGRAAEAAPKPPTA